MCAASSLHRDAARAGELPQSVGDLLGEPLLHREAPRVEPHEPRELRDAEDLVAGDVADVGAAVERQRMVLAQRVEADRALDDLRVAPLDALGPLGREERAQLRVAVVAGRRVEERLQEAPRRVARAGRVEVEAERREDLGGVALEPRPVRRSRGRAPLAARGREARRRCCSRDFLLSAGRALRAAARARWRRPPPARARRRRADGRLRAGPRTRPAASTCRGSRAATPRAGS